jgi:hypothetical protein
MGGNALNRYDAAGYPKEVLEFNPDGAPHNLPLQPQSSRTQSNEEDAI